MIFVSTMLRLSLPVVTNFFKIQKLCMHTGSVGFSCLRWYILVIDDLRQYILRVFIFAFLIQFAKIKTSRKFLLIQ